MKTLKLMLIIFLIASFVGCEALNINKSMTASECEKSKICKASGALTMKSDGHGFIGELKLADGSCIDVSLPDALSKEYIGKPLKRMEI